MRKRIPCSPSTRYLELEITSTVGQPGRFGLDVRKIYLEALKYIAFQKAPSLKAPEEKRGKHLAVMPEEQ